MLQNTEEETTQCYEMVYKLIKSRTFRNITIHFVNWISAFCSIQVFSIKGHDRGHLNMIIYRVILTVDNEISLQAFLDLNFK